jgi:hypothetical protein
VETPNHHGRVRELEEEEEPRDGVEWGLFLVVGER